MIITKSAQRGLSMIEVLIAMLIFAIGLLGVAGMQSLALKSTNNSNVRSLVNIHAYEIVERMRANMGAVETGQYNSVTAISGATNCLPSCTPTNLAAWDADEWLQNLQADIPGATGSVNYAGGIAAVTINWTERGLGNDAEAQTYTLRARIDQ
ncbi:type IV pilus modification protein PilV [Marinobacter caseinilyticus]|uniref:type IV pilus modification protein PilV n=1 Tax=Marinobacter caseinilyticus TaxID=2692195 RepID=UPI00140D4CE1|nr:type IV pilus modification protein PilV [Marinobacter caseinilyticus]